MQRIAMTPLAGIASGVERGLQAVGQIEQNRQAKQQTILNDMQIKEAQAKEADLNRVTTKQILFDNLQMGENVRSSVEPFYAMFANPDGNISKKNTFEMMKFLESNPMAKTKMLEGRHADVQKEYDTSKAELEEIKLSGNEKKIQQATQKFNIASQKLSGITQSMTDEKGNRLQIISKYGAAAEKFFNGEYTPDEFAKAVQEQELAKQNDMNKNQTEEQLTARALKGDKEAQSILDAMQKRKIDTAKQNRAIIVNNPMPKDKDNEKPKKPTGADIARVRKMIEEAGDEPTANDIALIQEAADQIGFDYVMTKEKTTKRGVPGTKILDFETGGKESWKLVKKDQDNTPKLRPIPRSVVEKIKKRAKTREDAERIAKELNFDPTRIDEEK